MSPDEGEIQDALIRALSAIDVLMQNHPIVTGSRGPYADAKDS